MNCNIVHIKQQSAFLEQLLVGPAVLGQFPELVVKSKTTTSELYSVDPAVMQGTG
jgi:hypothetical protein